MTRLQIIGDVLFRCSSSDTSIALFPTTEFSGVERPTDTAQMYDLDSNLSFYASSGNYLFIKEKFSYTQSITASELPNDIEELSVCLPGGSEIFAIALCLASVSILAVASLKPWR